MHRLLSTRVLIASIVLPALWIGMLIAIDALEAPLKFTAPGITIPLGLGIGRRVFAALNVAEALVATIWGTLLVRTRAPRRLALPLLAAVALLLVKVAILRPILATYTDAVLAGTSAGGSPVHVLYVACDLILGLVLCWALWTGLRHVKSPIETNTEVTQESNVGGSS